MGGRGPHPESINAVRTYWLHLRASRPVFASTTVRDEVHAASERALTSREVRLTSHHHFPFPSSSFFFCCWPPCLATALYTVLFCRLWHIAALTMQAHCSNTVGQQALHVACSPSVLAQ